MNIYQKDLFEVTHKGREQIVFQLSNGDFVAPQYVSGVRLDQFHEFMWIPRQEAEIKEYFRGMVYTEEKKGDTGMFHEPERDVKALKNAGVLATFSHYFGENEVWRAYDGSKVFNQYKRKPYYYLREELLFGEKFPLPLTSNRMNIGENGMVYRDKNFVFEQNMETNKEKIYY